MEYQGADARPPGTNGKHHTLHPPTRLRCDTHKYEAELTKGEQAGKIFQDWAQLPVGPEVYRAKVQAMQNELFPTAKPLPGVPQLLQTLSTKANPHVYLALATSSHSKNFALKTGHLGELFRCFKEENRVLGDDPRIGAGRGKPAPDIYLLALETVNEQIRKEGGKEISPAECLVFEDSVPGVESGRRAGMQVVWCPHPGLLNEYKGREEDVLAGLTGEYKEVEEKNEEIGVVAQDGQERKKGPPGAVGDGWAVLLQTLESFPYASYGIGL